MIYLDTSWLVKLFVQEAGADAVRRIVAADEDLVVSEVASVEFHAAVARRRREGALSAAGAASVVSRFRLEWTDRARMPVSTPVVDAAVRLVAAHPLRSLDAVQLASALLLARGAPGSVLFGTSDARLATVARREGLELAGSDRHRT